jgi:hypothetical protein
MFRLETFCQLGRGFFGGEMKLALVVVILTFSIAGSVFADDLDTAYKKQYTRYTQQLSQALAWKEASCKKYNEWFEKWEAQGCERGWPPICDQLYEATEKSFKFCLPASAQVDDLQKQKEDLKVRVLGHSGSKLPEWWKN